MSKVNLSFYKVLLVKEKEGAYNIKRTISTPEMAYEAIREITQIQHEAQEVFGMLVLDIKKNLIAVHELFRGTINGSLVHPREVFKPAILHNAAAIILFHNHPSGDPTPSKNDMDVIKKMRKAGKLLGIEVVDNIVVGDDCYVSAREDGLL